MPQLKSAEKRLRQNVKRRRRNRAQRAEIRTETRRLLRTIESGDREAARESLRRVFSLLDSAAGRGTVKKNSVARRKSRLARKINRLETAAGAESPPRPADE